MHAAWTHEGTLSDDVGVAEAEHIACQVYVFPPTCFEHGCQLRLQAAHGYHGSSSGLMAFSVKGPAGSW